MRNKQIITICFVIAFVCLMTASAEAVESSNENLQTPVELGTQSLHFEKN